MKKYHPECAIMGLIAIGLFVFIICVIGGIWLAHGLGAVFSKWGACPNYFSDFLGGALGLTIGFILDKICIEKIDQIFRYKKLMKIVRNELDNIQKIVYHNDDCELITKNIICKSENGSEKSGIGVYVKGKEICSISYDNLSYKGLSKIKDELSRIDSDSDILMREFIFGDIVKNAESMSVLANIPFAGKYTEYLTTQLCLIQKYIEQVAESKNEEQKKNWLLLQYYLNEINEVL